MSYIQESLPGFTQCVISFWFRVPQASLDAASNSATGQDGAMLDGIVPLVVLGQEGHNNAPTTQDTEQVLFATVSGTAAANYSAPIQTTQYSDPVPWPPDNPITTYYATETITTVYGAGLTWVTTTEQNMTTVYHTHATGSAAPKNPTFIGVDSSGTVYVNFETAKQASVTNYQFEISSYSPGSQTGPSPPLFGGAYPSDSPPPSPFAFIVGTGVTVIHYSGILDYWGTVVSTSFPGWTENPAYPGHVTQPEQNWTDITSVVMNTVTGTISGSGGATPAADHWHHVLVSVDLSKPIKTHGTSSRSDNISNLAPYIDSAAKLYIAVDDVDFPMGNSWAGIGNNGVLTTEAWNIAGAIATYGWNYATETEYLVGGAATYSLDASIPSGQIGIPARSQYTSHVHHCEMAEFQMWIGRTLNTSDQSNRRLFIDGKGNPVDPKTAASVLGKPNILLHGSGNWIKGHNTGTAGDLTPTGKIKAYKPDPSLYGPQFPKSSQAA